MLNTGLSIFQQPNEIFCIENDFLLRTSKRKSKKQNNFHQHSQHG